MCLAGVSSNHFLLMAEPSPMFELTMYTVAENDTSGLPLCVDLGVTITEPLTYTITTTHIIIEVNSVKGTNLLL